MYSSGKYAYSPHRRDLELPGGGGFWKSKHLKKCMKLNRNFQRGGEVLEKIPSVGEVWIFPETTQSVFNTKWLIFIAINIIDSWQTASV